MGLGRLGGCSLFGYKQMTPTEREEAAHILLSAVKSIQMKAVTPGEAALLYEAAAELLGKLRCRFRGWLGRAALDSCISILRNRAEDFNDSANSETS